MSTRYEVRWQHRAQTKTHTCPFHDEHRAEEFYEELLRLGGLNFLSLREVTNHELRRWQAAEQV